MSDHRPSIAVYAENVWKSYDNGAVKVLNGVTFEASRGQTIALCGPSGCGKSTLLHLLGGLDVPSHGRIVLNGEELSARTDTVRLFRHQIGFVFQLHHLIAGLTLEENCLLPASAAGVPPAEAKLRLAELLESTALSHRADQKIQKLSGGERQRAALCRSLMNKPSILLADEPTGSLDEKTSEQVFALLMSLAEKEGITLIMATHDRGLAARCNHLIEMRDGRIEGPTQGETSAWLSLE